MRFVIDNSVVMRWLFADGPRENLEYAAKILEILQAEGSVAFAPAAWPLEVGNVIARTESRFFAILMRTLPSQYQTWRRYWCATISASMRTSLLWNTQGCWCARII